MKKISTMSAALFQLREDADTAVNQGHRNLSCKLIRIVAEGHFDEALALLSEHSALRVSPTVIDFIMDVQGLEFQQFVIAPQNVWLNTRGTGDDDDGDTIVMALIIPPELRVRPPEVLNGFIESETTSLLKFFYSQEFVCTLGKPIKNRFPKQTT